MDAATVVDVVGRLSQLDRVPRSGYLLRGVTEPETVAAHSWALALLTQVVCDAHPEAFDTGRAVRMALIHDAAEAVTMDIPQPAGDPAFRVARRRAEAGIFRTLFAGLGDGYASAFDEYQRAQTPEARLVKGLDKVQMMIRVARYQREGRGNLEEFWTSPDNFQDYGIPVVRELFRGVAEAAGRTVPAAPGPGGAVAGPFAGS